MPTLRDLIQTLQPLTGLGGFIIERTADELATAGYIPTSKKAPIAEQDAANLLFALAASRAPSEAADLMHTYLTIPVSTVIIAKGGQARALDSQEIAALAGDNNILQSAPLFMAEMLRRDSEGDAWTAVNAEIVRGPDQLGATFHVCVPTVPNQNNRVEFRPSPIEPLSRGWLTTTIIGERVFSEITRFLHGEDCSLATLDPLGITNFRGS